jgi:hypothetical protein
MGGETTLIVVRVSLQDSKGCQIAISQATSNFNFVSHMLKEVKLMGVLICLARWVRIIEYSIQTVILQFVYALLPRAKHWVGGGVRFFPLKGSVVDVLVDLQYSVLSHLRVRLNLCSTDSHSKSNFEHMTSRSRYFISKSMHVRSFPGFHDRMTLDSQVGLTNSGFGAVV